MLWQVREAARHPDAPGASTSSTSAPSSWFASAEESPCRGGARTPGAERRELLRVRIGCFGLVDVPLGFRVKDAVGTIRAGVGGGLGEGSGAQSGLPSSFQASVLLLLRPGFRAL